MCAVRGAGVSASAELTIVPDDSEEPDPSLDLSRFGSRCERQRRSG
jgi:hypothetical protein